MCSLALPYVIGEDPFSRVGKSVLLQTDRPINEGVTVSLTALFQPKMEFVSFSLLYVLLHTEQA